MRKPDMYKASDYNGGKTTRQKKKEDLYEKIKHFLILHSFLTYSATS